MEDKNCDTLFEYLRCIIYEPERAHIEIEELDEEYRKLGQGLQYLEKALAEMRDCSAALAKGNLSEFTPHPDNRLCDNLKGIYSNMQHLTWQAKQVAKGDYSQEVSYLGDFSEAFNTMTSQLREREEALVREALYDPLTHLGNRYYFDRMMDSLAEKYKEVAFCYCDMDGLKYVNDTFGHVEGDAYISDFAEILRRNTRSTDILARIGGDEFCVVFVNCSVEAAKQRMYAIQRQFRESSGDRYDRCFSFGVVAVEAGGNTNIGLDDYEGAEAGETDVNRRRNWETAMERADEYMYKQKERHKRQR